MAYAPPQIPTFKSKFYLILSPQTLRNAALKKQKKKKSFPRWGTTAFHQVDLQKQKPESVRKESRFLRVKKDSLSGKEPCLLAVQHSVYRVRVHKSAFQVW